MTKKRGSSFVIRVLAYRITLKKKRLSLKFN